MLHQKLKDDMKEAMRAKQATRLTVIRGLLTALTNENVAKKRKPDTELSDEDAIAVITRSAKQRKDSIEQFVNGGREDLATSEREELVIVESYLPALMSEAEVRTIVEAKKKEMNISDPAEKGKFMGAVMRDLKGKADGTVVKNVIDSLFK